MWYGNTQNKHSVRIFIKYTTPLTGCFTQNQMVKTLTLSQKFR
jgi:hypothetical protein